MLIKILKGIIRQWLSKAINNYVLYKTVLKLNLIVLNAFTEKYIFNIYMLSLTIIGKIFSKSYSFLIIAEDNNGQYNNIN